MGLTSYLYGLARFHSGSLNLFLKSKLAMQLYEHVCDERECTDIGCANPDIPGAVLLKPAEYEIMDESRLPELVKLLSVGQLTGSPVGGLTFGAHVPEIKKRGERVSYPSGPTWQVGSCHHIVNQANSFSGMPDISRGSIVSPYLHVAS